MGWKQTEQVPDWKRTRVSSDQAGAKNGAKNDAAASSSTSLAVHEVDVVPATGDAAESSEDLAWFEVELPAELPVSREPVPAVAAEVVSPGDVMQDTPQEVVLPSLDELLDSPQSARQQPAYAAGSSDDVSDDVREE